MFFIAVCKNICKVPHSLAQIARAFGPPGASQGRVGNDESVLFGLLSPARTRTEREFLHAAIY